MQNKGKNENYEKDKKKSSWKRFAKNEKRTISKAQPQCSISSGRWSMQNLTVINVCVVFKGTTDSSISRCVYLLKLEI